MIQDLTSSQGNVNLTMAPVEDLRRSTPQRARRLPSRFEVTRTLQHLGTAALVIALSVACYFAISRFFVESVKVVGVSMAPTLAEGGSYVLNRWAYHDQEPARLDVVVLVDPGDHGFSVKRIIATPGQSVHFKDGKVLVNDKQIEEPYLASNTHTYTYSQAKEQLITLGAGQYFVLGDNRLKSIDSRTYGAVPRGNIIGKVMLR
jgi:signal peptidase I